MVDIKPGMKAEAQPPEDPGDDALIEAILGGEADQFRALMEVHQQAVFGYLYRLLLRDVDQARDLTQTVFFKAYRNLASFERGRPFAPWLLRIAHNEAANHLRSRSRRPEESLDDEAWERVPASGSLSTDALTPRTSTPEEVIAAKMDAQQINEAMKRLPNRMREALTLHYQEDQSYKDIAEVLGLSVGAVGTLIHRARNLLRKYLTP